MGLASGLLFVVFLIPISYAELLREIVFQPLRPSRVVVLGA